MINGHQANSRGLYTNYKDSVKDPGEPGTFFFGEFVCFDGIFRMSADSIEQWPKPWFLAVFSGMKSCPVKFRDYFICHEMRIPINQAGFHGCVSPLPGNGAWQQPSVVGAGVVGSVPESHGGGAEVFAQPTSTASGIQSLQRRWPEALGEMKDCRFHAGDFVNKKVGGLLFFFGWWFTFWMRGFQFIDRLMIPGFFGAELKRCWCWVAFFLLAGSSPVLVAGIMMTASMRFGIGRMTTKPAWSMQVSTWYGCFRK